MRSKSKFVFILGVINIILPMLVVLAHGGLFGSAENAWNLFWLAIAMVIIPIISSLAGIIIASIQLKKIPEAKAKIGLSFSCVGLLIHIIFRFVLKL